MWKKSEKIKKPKRYNSKTQKGTLLEALFQRKVSGKSCSGWFCHYYCESCPFLPQPLSLFNEVLRNTHWYARRIKLQSGWHGLSWMTLMDDFHVWHSWMTFIDDLHGWLLWMTFMDDFHGWLSWRTLSCYCDWKVYRYEKDKMSLF